MYNKSQITNNDKLRFNRAILRMSKLKYLFHNAFCYHAIPLLKKWEINSDGLDEAFKSRDTAGHVIQDYYVILVMLPCR